MLDLYTFWFGQKKLVRSEPSRNSERLNSESSSESASALKADWLFTFPLLLQTRFLNLDSVLNFSFYEKFGIENFDFLKYKNEIRITVFSIEFTATVSLLELYQT